MLLFALMFLSITSLVLWVLTVKWVERDVKDYLCELEIERLRQASARAVERARRRYS